MEHECVPYVVMDTFQPAEQKLSAVDQKHCSICFLYIKLFVCTGRSTQVLNIVYMECRGIKA